MRSGRYLVPEVEFPDSEERGMFDARFKTLTDFKEWLEPRKKAEGMRDRLKMVVVRAGKSIFGIIREPFTGMKMAYKFADDAEFSRETNHLSEYVTIIVARARE